MGLGAVLQIWGPTYSTANIRNAKGGTSNMNFYCWIKPPTEDVDAFEKLGNPGWNWAEYEKYSKQSETYVIRKPASYLYLAPAYIAALRFHPPAKEQTDLFPHTFDPNFRGTSGPVQVTIPPTVYTIDKLVQETLVNQGLKVINDPYGGDV